MHKKHFRASKNSQDLKFILKEGQKKGKRDKEGTHIDT